MNEPDLKEVEERLAGILFKERKEAIAYTVLTVLCTPTFLVLAGVVIFIMYL